MDCGFLWVARGGGGGGFPERMREKINKIKKWKIKIKKW